MIAINFTQHPTGYNRASAPVTKKSDAKSGTIPTNWNHAVLTIQLGVS
jgi:hypothetical protein